MNLDQVPSLWQNKPAEFLYSEPGVGQDKSYCIIIRIFSHKYHFPYPSPPNTLPQNNPPTPHHPTNLLHSSWVPSATSNVANIFFYILYILQSSGYRKDYLYGLYSLPSTPPPHPTLLTLIIHQRVPVGCLLPYPMQITWFVLSSLRPAWLVKSP